jgi:hypothetical protein
MAEEEGWPDMTKGHVLAWVPSGSVVVCADEKNLMNFCAGWSGERTSVPADAGLPEASSHWGCGQGAPHLHRSHRSNVPRSLQALQQARSIPVLKC